MRRIPLVKYAENHNPQQSKILNEVEHNTPLVLICTADAASVQRIRPFSVALNNS